MIVTYHHITPHEEIPADYEIFKRDGWIWCISPEQLELHIKKLRKKGFEFVSFEEYYNYIKKHNTEKYKLTVITFDDGWMDNYQYAYPLLRSLNIPGTFFITTSHLKGVTSSNIKVNKEMILEMHKNKMTIGSHTVNHTDLNIYNESLIEKELIESKNCLEDIINESVRFIAYPGGAFNNKTIEIAKKTGYEAACSIISPGYNIFKNRYYLYRNHFTDDFNSFRDLYRTSPFFVRLLEYRVRKKLYRKLLPKDG